MFFVLRLSRSPNVGIFLSVETKVRKKTMPIFFLSSFSLRDNLIVNFAGVASV